MICIKLAFIIASVVTLAPVALLAQSINFGDDASQWSNDGECDDRRIRGAAMAQGLDRDDIGHDATDCKTAFDAGNLSIWDFAAAKAATQCSATNFGDNNSEWPNDGQCDDYRFDGPGADYVLLPKDIGHEVNDCSQLCELGQIAIRDY